tara:strand:+ start:252 stop:452 length:201 start_codon:yes stop_codon:yes gene_type:complete
VSTSFHGGCAEASNKPRLDQSMVKHETRVIDVDGDGDVDILISKPERERSCVKRENCHSPASSYIS